MLVANKCNDRATDILMQLIEEMMCPEAVFFSENAAVTSEGVAVFVNGCTISGRPGGMKNQVIRSRIRTAAKDEKFFS